MKVSDLLESVSIGAGLIPGGMKEWKERFGATDADIQAAMVKARELPTYKELIKHTPEITTPRQQRNGTIAFKSFRHATNKVVRANGYEYRGWGQTYVHFYGQVRTGRDGADYNAPIKSIPPRIFPDDPVKTIVGAYNNGFKVMLNRYKHKRTKLPSDYVKSDLQKFLNAKLNIPVRMIYDGGNRNFLIFAKDMFKMTQEIFKGDANRKVNFMADLIDDDSVGADLRDSLLNRLRRKHAKQLETADDRNDDMVALAKLINTEYKTYDVHAEAMLMSEYQDKYKMFTDDWGGVHRIIAEKVMVVDVRNNTDDDEVEARNET